jgi:carboxylate-amine ligase
MTTHQRTIPAPREVSENLAPVSFGVEEEFFVVDTDDGTAFECNHDVVAAASRFGVDLDVELCPAQVETKTGICDDVRRLRAELLRLRTLTAAAALQTGGRLLAAGALPTVTPAHTVTGTPRYLRMAENYGRLITDQEICGCHVHVAVPDQATAVLVGNHLRPWLPALLGLTANSAIHAGGDTGFASWRAVTTAHWPCGGVPPYFTSAEHYAETVALMVDSGAILDHGMVYWDIRPSAHLPTVEVRVSDVPATIDETVLLATLVRALVATATRAVRAGDPGPPFSQELVRAAHFRAARAGLEDTWLDVRSGHLVPPRQVLGSLLRHLRPELSGPGDYRRTVTLLDRVLATGNGATRQRRTWQARRQVRDVVAEATRWTLQDTAPALP